MLRPLRRGDFSGYRAVKAQFEHAATRRSAEELRHALRTLPFSPFAPVRRQFCALLRVINGRRKTAGLELLPWDVLRLRRRSIKPFGDDQPTVLTAEQDNSVTQPPSPPSGSGELPAGCRSSGG